MDELESGYYWATDSSGERLVVEINDGEVFCFGVPFAYEVEEFKDYVLVKETGE